MGIWLNANTINNASADDFTAWSDIEEGDELVFIDGYGRGYSAHVMEKNTSTSTVSLVLDESIGTANESATLYYTTFKKIGQSLTRTQKDKEKIKASISDLSSPWAVIKIELRGFGLKVNMMELPNIIHKGGQ